MMNEDKQVRRAKHGPGGIKCSCCCEYPKKTAKRQDARRVRRKLKEDLRHESR